MMMAASTGSTLSRSPDGMVWTPVAGANRHVHGYFAGRYLSLGWPAAVFVSTDLVRWTAAFNPGGSGLVRLAIGPVTR